MPAFRSEMHNLRPLTESLGQGRGQAPSALTLEAWSQTWLAGSATLDFSSVSLDLSSSNSPIFLQGCFVCFGGEDSDLGFRLLALLRAVGVSNLWVGSHRANTA